MSNALRVPYSATSSPAGETGLRPYLPLTLGYQQRTMKAAGLVDSGASVNVLPYQAGLALGAFWEEQPATIQLGGNLAQFPARPLIVSVSFGPFASTRLAFAWTRAEAVPLILGQVNFFMEFDVCFYRSQEAFDVQPKR